jgi:hypothetical protein
MNPVPFTAKVKSSPPAAIDEGAKDCSTGAGLLALGGLGVELGEPPPQAISVRQANKPKEFARNRVTRVSNVTSR